MSSKSDRQSPTVPINNFTCAHCKIPKSVFKSNIEEEKYNDEIKKFCSKECKSSYALNVEDELNRRADELAAYEDRLEELRMDMEEYCPPCDAAMAEYEQISKLVNSPSSQDGGMRGGATEITDNTLEKKLIDATAPYNEKAARNAENFAKASIEVGKAILDQLQLDPFAFINKAKALGIKITEITKEGIFLLFPGDASMGESVDKLIKSGTKLYFLPVRILGTIAITIFLSMFDVFIPLKFLEKIPGLKPFIDLIMKYTAIIPTILKNLKIPNLSFGSLIDSDVMDASYLRKGSKYEYKPTRNTEGGRKKKRKTRRKKRRKN